LPQTWKTRGKKIEIGHGKIGKNRENIKEKRERSELCSQFP